MKTWIPLLVTAIGAALIGRLLFPVEVDRPVDVPRIITVHDTIETIDTTWITRVRTDVIRDTINLVEVVTVERADTLYQCPPVLGVYALEIPNVWGDSTLVGGFKLTPVDTGYTYERWRAQYFTPGPLRAMIADSLPPVMSFWPAPPICRCNSLTKTLIGAAGGFLACTVLN